MGKKSRNKRRDDKNVKSKANSETHKKAETTKNDDQRLMIEIQISRPQFPQQILECKTQNNSVDPNMNKIVDTLLSRYQLGAKMAMQAVMTFVEKDGGQFDDDIKKATMKMINEKMNKRLLEVQKNQSPDVRGQLPRFHVDDNGVVSLVDDKIENVPIESNSSATASTSATETDAAADALAKEFTSESKTTTADDSGMKQVFVALDNQKIQRLESIESEASANNSETLPVDSDVGEQSDGVSEGEEGCYYYADPFDLSGDLRHDDYVRMYHCLHCQSKLGDRNQFGTFKKVYNHWEREHNHQLQTEPFYFYTTEFANCVYCDLVGTYWELLKHQRDRHPSFPIALTDIINCRKCALCTYIGDNIPAHSQMHRVYNKNFSRRHIARMTNPLTYTNETYNERLQLRIHRKHRCLECGLAFDTAFLQRQHFLFRHPQSSQSLLKYNAKVFYDNSRHMICGCCCARIPWNGFIEHISSVTFEFPCDKCLFTFTDLVALIVHDRTDHGINNSMFMRTSQLSNRLKKYYQSTRIVHGNGLVVTRQNILSTKHNDWPEFSDYIDGLVETVKTRLKEMNFFEMGGQTPKKRNRMIQTVSPPKIETSKSSCNDDDTQGENRRTNTPKPKPPMVIVYKRSSKKCGNRILCHNIIKKKPTQLKPMKTRKPNKKTNQTNETNYSQSVTTRSTQFGHRSIATI